jgi:DNA-directed RNA polymerase specialized sigma24 family protein
MILREKELITGLQQGNRPTFDFLLRNYFSGWCSYAYKYLKSAYISEEIVQEVSVKLRGKHNKIIIHASIRAYLYQNIFNGCMNYIKGIQSSGLNYVDLKDISFRNKLMAMDLSDSEFSRGFSDEVEWTLIKNL